VTETTSHDARSPTGRHADGEQGIITSVMLRPRVDAAVLTLALVATACTGRANRTAAPSDAPAPDTPAEDGVGLAIERHPGSSLTAIDGSGPTDIWAVGERHGTAIQSHSLVAHWDGTAWTLVSVPDVGRLVAVDATETNDAWALGGRNLLRWDRATWSSKPLPRGNYTALSATGPSDVWIAGVRPGLMIGKNTRGWSSAIAHYDGTQWIVMRTPNPGTRDNYVEGIVASSSTDVWAGGYFVNVGKHVPEANSFTMHWDGKTWAVARSPNPSPSLDVIWSMGHDDSGNVWALGQHEGTDHHLHTLVLRWTGDRWAAAPIGGTSLWSAQAVAGSTSGPTWVVGSPATSSFAIARCNNAACDTVVGPTSGSAWSVYSASPDDAWVVGVASSERSRPLVHHWDGRARSSGPFPGVPSLP
jgi:hypothetical protein